MSKSDVAAIAARVRATGAEAVVTTEKDAVRLLPLRPLPFAAVFVPLTVTIEPEDVFTRWLLDRLAAAAHPAAQLIKLGKAEAVRTIHNQRIGGRNIETRFDNRGREQHVIFAVIEG